MGGGGGGGGEETVWLNILVSEDTEISINLLPLLFSNTIHNVFNTDTSFLENSI